MAPYVFTVNKALSFILVESFFFTLTTSLSIFLFRSLLDRHSKVELLFIWPPISLLTVSDVVMIQCILELFLFSNFTTNVSSLYYLISWVKATIWFNARLLCLVCNSFSGFYHFLFDSCFLVSLLFYVDRIWLDRYVLFFSFFLSPFSLIFLNNSYFWVLFVPSYC